MNFPDMLFIICSVLGAVWYLGGKLASIEERLHRIDRSGEYNERFFELEGRMSRTEQTHLAIEVQLKHLYGGLTDLKAMLSRIQNIIDRS